MTRTSASTALFALFIGVHSLGAAPVKADAYVLVLSVEATDEADGALALMADSMLRDALLEMPDVHLIDWTPTRATVASTCQTVTMDATCLEVVAARFSADFIVVPTVGRQSQASEVVRHLEARVYDAEAHTLGDSASATFDADTDPELALALLEVLMNDEDDDLATEETREEIDSREGRSIAAYATARLGRAFGDAHRASRDGHVRSTSLVPSTSPCATSSALADPTTRALCEQEHATSTPHVLVLDGAGPAGHIALADGTADETLADGHGDRLDRMLERIRLNGRFSRTGVRVGAKIAF